MRPSRSWRNPIRFAVSTIRTSCRVGRRLFDIVNGPDGWNKDMGYGADQTGAGSRAIPAGPNARD